MTEIATEHTLAAKTDKDRDHEDLKLLLHEMGALALMTEKSAAAFVKIQELGMQVVRLASRLELKAQFSDQMQQFLLTASEVPVAGLNGYASELAVAELEAETGAAPPQPDNDLAGPAFSDPIELALRGSVPLELAEASINEQPNTPPVALQPPADTIVPQKDTPESHSLPLPEADEVDEADELSDQAEGNKQEDASKAQDETSDEQENASKIEAIDNRAQLLALDPWGGLPDPELLPKVEPIPGEPIVTVVISRDDLLVVNGKSFPLTGQKLFVMHMLMIYRDQITPIGTLGKDFDDSVRSSQHFSTALTYFRRRWQDETGMQLTETAYGRCRLNPNIVFVDRRAEIAKLPGEQLRAKRLHGQQLDEGAVAKPLPSAAKAVPGQGAEPAKVTPKVAPVAPQPAPSTPRPSAPPAAAVSAPPPPQRFSPKKKTSSPAAVESTSPIAMKSEMPGQLLVEWNTAEVIAAHMNAGLRPGEPGFSVGFIQSVIEDLTIEPVHVRAHPEFSGQLQYSRQQSFTIARQARRALQ